MLRSPSPILRPGLALGLALSLTPAARAHDYLYASGQTGLIERGDPTTGHMESLVVCVGAVSGLAFEGDDLFIATAGGGIGRFNETSANLESWHFVSNDATAITADPVYLYVSGSDGSVLKLERSGLAQLDAFSALVPVTAMVQVERTLFAGSSFGVVMKGDADLGDFQLFGTCGGPVRSMAIDATHLVVADANGTIYRIGLASETIDASFPTGTDGAGLVLHGSALLVGDSSGFVERRDAHTGALLASIDTDFDVAALAIGDGSSIATIYCFGQHGCPCGNDTWVEGCRNSTGRGSSSSATGSASASADDLVLRADGMPANQWGRFYMGATASHAPFGDGLRCAGSGGYGLFRFPIRNSGPSGAIEESGLVQFSHERFGPAGQIAPGQSWYFQAWYRDPLGPCGAHFNTSSAAAVTFSP